MREKIKLESTAGTGHFYTTTKNKRTRPAKWMATVAPNEIAGSECASQIGDIEAVQNLNLLFIEGVMGRVLLQGLPAPDTPARLGYIDGAQWHAKRGRNREESVGG